MAKSFVAMLNIDLGKNRCSLVDLDATGPRCCASAHAARRSDTSKNWVTGWFGR